MEGPLTESAEAEVARFDQETAQDIGSALAEVDQSVAEVTKEANAVAASDPTSRHLGNLAEDDYSPQVTVEDLGEPVYGAEQLQQAVVMVEVLGRPKGARYFSRSR